MAGLIEDYAIIGDTHTVALVGLDGSVDWLCMPRFDSPACFASLLGEPEHGHWRLAPATPATTATRRYRGDTLILETEFTTPQGTVAVIDFMPPRERDPSVVRIVEGRSGTVPIELELICRFDYGSIVPWVRAIDGGLSIVAGGEAIRFDAPVELQGQDLATVAHFDVSAGDRLCFALTWYRSHEPIPDPLDGEHLERYTETWWTRWSDRCTYDGEWRDEVMRSLITLKALTYAPSGGIVAAATTSLPEQLGGVRNWDYRYCWLRDATFTLHCLLENGYHEEALAWAAWLRRAVAGEPGDFQIMYGLKGNRRLTEFEIDWLPGYEGSAPVRVGNGASGQFQLDVFGEVMDMASVARNAFADGRIPADVASRWSPDHDGVDPNAEAWDMQLALMEHLEAVWQQPDDGIWEVRGPRRHFTHSKVMAWVAADRAVRAVEQFGRKGPVERWRTMRDEIHRQVCEKGYDAGRRSFVQYYGSTQLDASLLALALVGFLPPDDPRIVGTVEAIQRELTTDGFVRRYETAGTGDVDGLPEGEGAFLMTTFWLVDNLALMGRRDEAMALFEQLRGLQNDVGLFAEEYDVAESRMVGNFPQAFSHVAFVNSALNLSRPHDSPATRRSAGSASTAGRNDGR